MRELVPQNHRVFFNEFYSRPKVAQRQEMVIGTLALLWYFLMVAVK